MATVAILGGGIGGLSAAHELSERGFDVTVYEARAEFGGKARSMPVPGSGTGGRDDLPAEHGFRFFPGFYQHVTDTMKRIPYGGTNGAGSVYDNLTKCTQMMIARDDGRNEMVAPAGFPTTLEQFVTGLASLRDIVFSTGVPVTEFAVFVEKILTAMTSCDERRLGEFEAMSWWDFVEADGKSAAYQKFLATGMTRTLVAAKADQMSARTGSTVLCQLLYDMLQIDGRLDNVLNGPTSEVWIDPWLALLKKRGVNLRPECHASGFVCDGGRITSVTITTPNGDESVEADYYIAALPCERFELLISPAMRAADPQLALISELTTGWMNGVMFYLDADVPLDHGHAIFIDSEWALTAISQKQFWPGVDLEQRGDGRVGGILSVDVSDWTKPGRLFGKAASACTKDEIRQEVWAQIVAHIDDGSLDAANVVTWFLDPGITFPNPGQAANAEQLLVNTKGSWAHRPDATTAIGNLFLASDFVRTNTDLATMEGANEAARRAVNGILEASGSAARKCAVFELQEPSVLWGFRQLDRVRWKLGQKPAPPPFRLNDEGELEPTGLAARTALATLKLRENHKFLGKI